MKKLLLFLLLLSIGKLFAQEDFQVCMESRAGCLPDGIVFGSQAQVDSFAIHYPDCNTILGDVTIDGYDITNLNALININRIEGGLYFYEYDWGNSFTSSGLDSLHYTGGLYFEGLLLQMEGLNNLDTINGDLSISSCLGSDLTGLENIKHLSGNLGIEWGQDLSNLNGLQGLRTIGGSLELSGNSMLEDISALNNLISIGGNILIKNNNALNSLEALNNIDVSLIDGLLIYKNSILSVCDEPFICEYLSNLTGPVTIYNNAPGCNSPAEIADSCGITLSCLPYGNYYLTSQSAVDNFWSDYPDCSVLNGELKIAGDDIVNLSGLLGITQVNGSVNIGTTYITDLSGLDSLKSITGGLCLGWWYGEFNPLLVNFNGLQNLERIGGWFLVMYNPSLQNFTGLDNLRSTGEFSVGRDDALVSFEGLTSLDSIRGPFYFSNNPIASLTGLEHLKYVEGELVVGYNELLNSLNGLDSVQPGSLKVNNNPQLSECDIKSICTFLGIPSSVATFSNNAVGCNSREEVEEECITGVNDISPESNLIIYPNPTNDLIMIKIPGNLAAKTITVYNSTGQVLMNKIENGSTSLIDVSGFPDGLYILVIRENNQCGRFMKNSHE